MVGVISMASSLMLLVMPYSSQFQPPSQRPPVVLGRSCVLLRRLVGGGKNVRLARVVLALHSGDDPVAGADDVSALQRVDPAVVIHGFVAMVATQFLCRCAVVSHHLAFPVVSPAMLSRNGHQTAVLETALLAGIVQRVVAVLEPLRGFNNHRLLAIFHVFSSAALMAARA